VLVAGPRVLPWMLRQVARTGSRELFTLALLAAALGIAYGSAKLFGVSFALGAFFAGMVLHESDLSHKAAASSMPLQDAFAVLFFVSVGMLFDPSVIVREPLKVSAVLLLILVGKSLVAMAIVLLLGYPFATAMIVSASLAQIGEFSFILAGLGITYQLMPIEGLNLILAGALLSITLNPLLFAGADRVVRWVRSRPGWRQRLEDNRSSHFAALQRELDRARERAEKKAAEHKTFSPEELAQRFPLFSDLTPEQREVLLLHFQAATAQPGERVIRQGAMGDKVYFICDGEVEVSVAGQRIKLVPGDYFGEMALLQNQPRSADVTALDFCKFVTLNRSDFRLFLRRFPQLRERISAMASQRGEMNKAFLEEGEDDASPAAEKI
jgi:CPA2 family monovalent cation:H+ antiporter-2